ncbi:MAG: SMC-Scp complex subunit ScpB [Planctomycetaceae bacterium]|nr:SMC-Scp complex subunit ScpB [Planctomycetaceae bacterium]
MTPLSSFSLPSVARTTSGDEFQRWHQRRGKTPETRRFSKDSSESTVRSEKAARLEAALLVAGGPLSSAKLAQFATLSDPAEVKRLVAWLNAAYDQSHSAFRIERVASGYVLLTRPEFNFWLSRLHQRQSEMKLSAPQLETLTIIAYRQPITRADVEAVRGVQCAEMLKQLMERGLVKIGGEDESLGRPYLYVTTRKFLEMYGLRSLDEMPMSDTLRKPASQSVATVETDEEAEVAAASAAA